MIGLLIAISLAAQSPPVVAAQDDACPPGARVEPDGRLRSEAVCALLATARATNSDAVAVMRGGRVVAEWSPEGAPERIHVMSVTKSVVALAVGRMLLDGSLASLDQPVSELFPEWRQGRKADVTIRHLLTHTSGLQDVPNAGLEIEPAPDAVRLALAAELEAEPGAAFRYNNKAVNLLAGIARRATGEELDDYLGRTVFHDLAIRDFEWIEDPAGNPYAMAGLVIGAADLAKLGALVVEGGRWQGRQIVDADFARDAVTTRHDLYPRHGYLWWLIDAPGEGADYPGFYADGWLGQWVVALPDSDLVAVRLIDRASWTGEADTFADFRERVLELVER